MKRLVYACLLALALLVGVMPAAAVAHNGATHLPPTFSPSGGADADPVTARDVGPRLAQILDTTVGTKWRSRNYPTPRSDTCLYNVPNGSIEADICQLWEMGVWDSNIQPNARIYLCPSPAPAGSRCVDLNATFDRNYGSDILWKTIFNGYDKMNALNDSGSPQQLSPGTGAPAWEHGRQSGTEGELDSALLNFPTPCYDEQDLYVPGGGPQTCNHGRGYQVYTDIDETWGWIGYNRIARLSYPDMRVVEPWTSSSGLTGKWNPTIHAEDRPEWHGAEPLSLGEFVMWTGRTYCALLSHTQGGLFTEKLNVSDECWQSQWVDANNGVFGRWSFWGSDEDSAGRGFWLMEHGGYYVWNMGRFAWGWDGR